MKSKADTCHACSTTDLPQSLVNDFKMKSKAFLFGTNILTQYMKNDIPSMKTPVLPDYSNTKKNYVYGNRFSNFSESISSQCQSWKESKDCFEIKDLDPNCCGLSSSFLKNNNHMENLVNVTLKSTPFPRTDALPSAYTAPISNFLISNKKMQFSHHFPSKLPIL